LEKRERSFCRKADPGLYFYAFFLQRVTGYEILLLMVKTVTEKLLISERGLTKSLLFFAAHCGIAKNK
jgi:hypothetical protein